MIAVDTFLRLRGGEVIGSMLGLLGGVLNGAAFGRDVIDFNYNQNGATNTGQFVVQSTSRGSFRS